MPTYFPITYACKTHQYTSTHTINIIHTNEACIHTYILHCSTAGPFQVLLHALSTICAQIKHIPWRTGLVGRVLVTHLLCTAHAFTPALLGIHQGRRPLAMLMVIMGCIRLEVKTSIACTVEYSSQEPFPSMVRLSHIGLGTLIK